MTADNQSLNRLLLFDPMTVSGCFVWVIVKWCNYLQTGIEVLWLAAVNRQNGFSSYSSRVRCSGSHWRKHRSGSGSDAPEENEAYTTTSVTHLMNLTEGDHISLKKKGDLPFSHAIVVKPVHSPKDMIKVVYHSGSKASARVEYAEVDLHEQARNGELFRHQYEVLICFPAEAVVARAVSLCSHSDYNTCDRREFLRSYWPFFRDDEHFANWCQIGFSFKDSFKAIAAADYSKTLVSDMAHLNEGASCIYTYILFVSYGSKHNIRTFKHK